MKYRSHAMLASAAYLSVSLFNGAFATEQGSPWYALGAFGSADDDTGAGSYQQYEIYGLREFSWQAELGPIEMTSSLFAGFGWYEQAGDALEYVTVGNVFNFTKPGSMVSLEVGARPGWLFDYESPGRNFGGHLTFFDHIGVMVQPLPEVTLGYRFQHMSNASLYKENPGINMHLLDLRFHF